MTDSPAILERPPRRGSLGGIGLSSAIAAGLAIVLHVVAGRELGASGYARFLVIWGLFFTLTGILPGLQQEVTRSVATARKLAVARARPIVGTLLIGVTGAVIVLGTSPLWAPHVVDGNWRGVSAILGLAFLVFACANHVNGTLAAQRMWPFYSGAILFDGLVRAMLVTAVLLVGSAELAWAGALMGSSVVWLVLIMNTRVRAATVAHGDRSTRAFVVGSLGAMLAAGCSALIVAGFPVLLSIFAYDTSRAGAGVVLAVLMATRAPLLLLLNAYQGVLITRLVDSPSPTRQMSRWIGAGTMVAMPIAAFSYVAGPRLLLLVFGPGYVASGQLFVGLVVSGLALSIVTVTGWTSLALGQHAAFVGGWLVAAAVTSALLTIPVSLTASVSLALTIGPISGAAVHIAVAAAATRNQPSNETLSR